MDYFLPPIFRGPSADVLPLPGEVNWGMTVFGVDFLRSLTTGKGFKIGGVDTGVDENHPLMGNLVKAKDFTGSSNGYADTNGHGTHISGTIAATDPRIGVGPEFSYYHGKGLSNSGGGSMSALLNGIEFCLSEGCEIVSNSWGGGTTVDSATDRLFREWAEAGKWIIFAAGNSGGNTNVTDAPGNSQHVLNTAALNQDLSPASFTSAGDKIDSSGPGVNIWSLKPGGGFQQMSGTSMATPFNSGVYGLLRHSLQLAKRPVPDIYELRKVLFSRSTDTYLPGDDRRTGPGWVSPILLRSYLTPDPVL